MRVAYLGPEGTNSHEALLAATRAASAQLRARLAGDDLRLRDGGAAKATAERAFVPIENALEGSVNATLDALAVETDDVAIVGEHVHAIHTCLIAAGAAGARRGRDGRLAPAGERASARTSCARDCRRRRVLAASSTAEAVRARRRGGRRGAPRSAAAPRRSCTAARCCARTSTTRPATRRASCGWRARDAGQLAAAGRATARWKTAIVFWGVGAEAPGWLVRCLSEFAVPRRQPDAHRVAPAQAGARPLHVLLRPRRARVGGPGRRGAGGAARRTSSTCACSARSPPHSPSHRSRSHGSAPRSGRTGHNRPLHFGPRSWLPLLLYHQRKWGPRRLWGTSGADVSLAGCSSSTRPSSRSTSARSGARSCCC